MKTKVVGEYGCGAALFGMGLSHGVTSGMELKLDGLGDIAYEAMDEATYERLLKRSKILAHMDGGHNKFLESIVVYLDITAPRYWWQQFDTYRSGVTKQSQSTMHTGMKREVTVDDFEDGEHIPKATLWKLNDAMKCDDFEFVQANRPESFLQRRIVCTNYKTLRNIVKQREDHKLKQWRSFCKDLKEQLNSPEYIWEEGF